MGCARFPSTGFGLSQHLGGQSVWACAFPIDPRAFPVDPRYPTDRGGTVGEVVGIGLHLAPREAP